MKWTNQGIKPRISKVGKGERAWRCMGAGRAEFAPTPLMAYWLWRSSEPRVSSPHPKVPTWIAPHHPTLDYFNRHWMETMA